jgi:hypothetical protein
MESLDNVTRAFNPQKRSCWAALFGRGAQGYLAGVHASRLGIGAQGGTLMGAQKRVPL